GSLLVSVMNSTLLAGLVNVTANGANWPGATITPDAMRISAAGFTVMLTTTLATLGAAGAAVIIANPGATPVTGTIIEIVFGPNVTKAGTVATLELLDVRLTVRPEAGAGDDRGNVRI